jgi:hypothetical protein
MTAVSITFSFVFAMLTAIQVLLQPAAALTSRTAGNTTKPSASVTVSASNGVIPATLPNYFSFGVFSRGGAVSQLDDMHKTNGTAFTYRYQSLSDGVNTGRGWETWNKPEGQFVTGYIQESVKHGYTPTFAYYEICQSNGPHDGSYCHVNDREQDVSNLATSWVMKDYYKNWVMALKRIGASKQTVLVIVEPDLWGFLQQVALKKGKNSAADIYASVSSSGYTDAKDYPDNAQGFAWAMLHMRDEYAPNAVLALHSSTWSAGPNIATEKRANLDVAALALKEAAFLNSAGIVGNPDGVSTWDLLSNDMADYDSAQPGGRSWWDRYNKTFPNFSRYLNFIGSLSKATHRRIVLWQVPMGNQYFDTMDNSQGHYQDNRAEYILGHVKDFAKAGVIAVLFGAGNDGTKNIDAMQDGVTNPDPITNYECNGSNTHVSQFADDDGGYLRIFVGKYSQHRVVMA